MQTRSTIVPGWFEKLKGGLIKFLQSKEQQALLTSNVQVETSAERRSGTGQTERIANRRGVVNIDNSVTTNVFLVGSDWMESDLSELRQKIGGLFTDGELKFVSKKAATELKDYNTFESEGNTGAMIKYFSNKIDPQDLQLLRTGLYIQNLAERGEYERVNDLKRDIARGGSRARNIVNLASEGYFGSYIKPMFDSGDYEQAQIEYREVVEFLPAIVFVNANMTAGEVVAAVEDRIRRREVYHVEVKNIMVNGIGGKCRSLINDADEVLRKKYKQYEISTSSSVSSNGVIRTKMRIAF